MKKEIKALKKKGGKGKKKQDILDIGRIFALVFLGISIFFAGINLQNISGAAVYNEGVAVYNGRVDYRGINPTVDPFIVKPGDTTLTIYGACRDSDLHPLVNSNAKITIYNSTQDKWINAQDMSSMITGRFNYSTNAPTSPGNYFVEMNCTDGSSWALAYDNFQVADWAKDIGDIEGYLEDVNDGGLSTINSEVAGLDGAAMRGTDSAALASSLTTHDTDIKTYVDKIDDATNGLTAIKAEVEGIGGAAMRGTDGAALASDYTAARAAKIDNLDTTVSSRLAASSYVTERGTDGAALASSYTSTRAGYLDRLDTTVSSRMAASSYVTERGTDNAETEASASSRYSAVYGQVDNAYSACYVKGQNTGITCGGSVPACAGGWTSIDTFCIAGSGSIGVDETRIDFNVCCLAR